MEEAPVLDLDGNPTSDTVAVNPIPNGNRAMISEDPAAKFGQLPSADMGAYESSVKALISQVMAASACPRTTSACSPPPRVCGRPEGC